MTLGEAQEKFAVMYAKLIIWGDSQGYKMRLGDVFAKSGHKPNSNHYLKLAGDIFIYKPGAQEQDEEAHSRMHDAWDALGGAPRIKDDMNHYSLMWNGSW